MADPHILKIRSEAMWKTMYGYIPVKVIDIYHVDNETGLYKPSPGIFVVVKLMKPKKKDRTLRTTLSTNVIPKDAYKKKFGIIPVIADYKVLVIKR